MTNNILLNVLKKCPNHYCYLCVIDYTFYLLRFHHQLNDYYY